MTNLEKEQGYLKHLVPLYIESSVGDHWKSEKCTFIELKSGGFIVDWKEKDKKVSENPN